MAVIDPVQAAAPRDHFTRIAARWSHFGPPLRPSPDETAIVQRAAARLDPGARVVVLGLTPEIIGCDWPSGVKLSAVDHSPKMMEALWPPQRGPADAEAILADWCDMPIAQGTVDLVAGDGCYVLLPFPHGYDVLMRSVSRVLKSRGSYVIRVFLRPDQSESVADIAGAVGTGNVGSVHALKLRLLAALHGASGAGTLLDDVGQVWKTMPPLPASRAGTPGWTQDEITGIESYAGMSARYHLPTLAEFRESAGRYFDEIECAFGSHELAGLCPTLVLAKRD